jgi:hypothetical protein
MLNSFEILHRINSYLDGDISLEAFRKWMVEQHLAIEANRDSKDFDAVAAHLLADIEARYAELSDEGVLESDWKGRLRSLIVPGGIPSASEVIKVTARYQPIPPAQPRYERSSTTNENPTVVYV